MTAPMEREPESLDAAMARIEATYLTPEAREFIAIAELTEPYNERIAALEAENERLRTQLSNSDAWFGAWECGCSDTERSPLGIPEFCPVHGRNLISNSRGSTKVQLNHSGVSGYGFKRGPS